MHTSKQINYLVRPGGILKGCIQVPGDKSISHRAIMLGSLAEGVTRIEGLLFADDCLATMQAFAQMGVKWVKAGDDCVHITGVGLHGLKPPTVSLDLGNSGTAMRLLTGILSGQQFDSCLTGDASLRQRPMNRITEPLTQMGAKITTRSGKPPVSLQGGQQLHAIRWEMPVASAQVKSCLLLAGMYAVGETVIVEPGVTRDHSERMLNSFAYPVSVKGRTLSICGGGRLQAGTIQVPGDLSSAAFFMVAACMVEGSDLVIQNAGVNPTRTGVIKLLRMMGADIDVFNERSFATEPVADIRVKYAPLHGIEIPDELVPLAIDEFPILFIAAAMAQGDTLLHGAKELRYKESDRIRVMIDGLKQLGIKAKELTDGVLISGGTVCGGAVNSQGDHRVAMAFTMAGISATAEIKVYNCAQVSTSFPGFVALAQTMGLDIVEEDEYAGNKPGSDN